MEVDPSKMEEGQESSSAVNKYKLLLTSQKLFQLFLDSKQNMPAPIRAVLNHAWNALEEKFSASRFKALSGFLFLRFLSPAITAPSVYGISKVPPSTSVQRTLILLSKVLQSLANEVPFGSKELHMANLNDFIVQNQGNLRSYLNFVAQPVSESAAEGTVHIPEVVLINSVSFLHHYLWSIQSKIYDDLKENNHQDTLQKLQEILQHEPASHKH
jgi:neurofibromin 1